MNIAIVTGAAGGIGKEFIKLMLKEPGVDEIWAVGRTESRLRKLVEECRMSRQTTTTASGILTF